MSFAPAFEEPHLMYERPKVTEIGNVEDLTQGTIKLKANFSGLDIHFNKDRIVITGGKAGVQITT